MSPQTNRIFRRLVLAPFVIWGAAYTFILLLALKGCRLDEASVYPCVILGRDIGGFADGVGSFVAWGLLTAVVPASLFIVAIWKIADFIERFARDWRR
ncbi:MAG: hypothetical protein CVT82_11465 [Alphaproteobacteria bacterium HGW-Alphaproteobacteria-4]|nr:MAG: hypothetical protein CVT82_11465 [Alphaproteobacteria bacterium HGW-Alphaproteobacteria-4]